MGKETKRLQAGASSAQRPNRRAQPRARAVGCCSAIARHCLGCCMHSPAPLPCLPCSPAPPSLASCCRRGEGARKHTTSRRHIAAVPWANLEPTHSNCHIAALHPSRMLAGIYAVPAVPHHHLCQQQVRAPRQLSLGLSRSKWRLCAGPKHVGKTEHSMRGRLRACRL